MRRLSDPELLHAWESGRNASPTGRAIAVLGIAVGDRDKVRTYTPGQCDAHLLALRRLTFGHTLDCVASCPACQEALEFTLDTADLSAIGGNAPANIESVDLMADDYQTTIRPPTLGDLEVAGAMDETTLLRACVISAEHDGAAIAAEDLPPSVVSAIDERLAIMDPGAVIELSLDCPTCRHAWDQLFDIAAYLWMEIQAQAERLMREVHVLARAYGWSEPEVLALSPARRQGYLDLVGGVS